QLGAALQCREVCVQRFGGQAVQQQAVAGSQRGERHQGMLVVHQIHRGGVADDSRGIDRDGLIQLERITGAPEVAIRQEQLIERRVYLDRRFEVENIEAPFRQGVYVDIKWVLSHCGEVELFLLSEFDTTRFHLAVQPDDEIVDVQVVLQKDVVDEIAERARTQWFQGYLNSGHIGRHKMQDVRSDMEMTQDHPIRIRADEVLQTPVDGPMQDLRRREAVRNDNFQNLKQDDERL